MINMVNELRVNDLEEYTKWDSSSSYGYDMKNTVLKFKAFGVPQYRWTYYQWFFNYDIY